MSELLLGDCLEVMRTLPDCSVDAVVTDPPYGLAFMGKRWDYDVPTVAVWAECLRVLKPGGHLLVLDFSVPPAPLRWLYRPYLHHVLPWLAGVLTGEKAAYDYLGDSIEKFPVGPAMCALLAGAGFSEAQCEPLSGGIVALYTARRN